MKIRTICAALVFFCYIVTPLSAQQLGQGQTVEGVKKEILTNDTVIELTKMGLSDATIIEKIRQSDRRFDTSLEGLKQLKAAQVSDAVIREMINPQSVVITSSSKSGSTIGDISPTARPSSVGTDSSGKPIPWPPDKGAYFWDGKKLELLFQSTVPSAGSNFWRSVTPFVRKKMEFQLLGAYSKLFFDDTQPTIVLSGLGDVIPGVPAFRWLYVKSGGMLKDRRIVGTYDVGGFFGSIQMVDNEIECEIKKVADGLYTIRPLKTLADGEYGLVPVPRLADASSKPSFAPPIWDFGIYAEGRRPDKKK